MTATEWIHLNPGGRRWQSSGVDGDPREFHRGLPRYEPTPLRELRDVAAAHGVGRVLVKDESDRLGLPAFKVLGASYALQRIVEDQTPTALVTATDGNHGRALARAGRLLGVRVRVHVPDGVHPAAIEAIEGEGARVVPARAGYDEAVRRAGADADTTGALLVQDTAWPGYERIPGWIVDGYTTLFAEIDDRLPGGPDVVLVPVGVGSLALAALGHYRSRSPHRPAVVSVEPTAAACVLASLRAGERITVGTGTTIMAGLNCGTPSSSAWPALRDGLDAAVAITDADCARAMGTLAAAGIDAGPCGAATLAGLEALLAGPGEVRRVLRLHADATVVLLNTESTTANPAMAS